MSIEADIIAKYASVFGGRLYWGEADGLDGLVVPFGILQRNGGNSRQYVDDTVEPEWLTTDVLAHVWGRDVIAVANKMADFVAAVRASNTADWIARPLREAIGDRNDVLDIRGLNQDFRFVYRNPRYQG